MSTKLDVFNKAQLIQELPDIRPGDTIKVFQRITEGSPTGGKEKKEKKEKIQAFEGLVIARKHGKGVSATITVRKIISGIGVEKIFPVHSPTIEKIEILKRGKARRAKLYYLREARGKRARLKKEELVAAVAEEEPGDKAEETEEKDSKESETITEEK